MKLVRMGKVRKDGTRLVTVEVSQGETVTAVPQRTGRKMIRLDPDKMYSLGEPLMGTVVSGHTILDAARVAWCGAAQEWVDVGEDITWPTLTIL